MGQLGIGIIGAGRHGLRYIRHLTNDVTGATLVALCRRDRREGHALAVAHGCTFHAEWRDLVADPRVDAVITVVPPVLNAAIAEAATAAGKSLLIEKPLAHTLADAKRIAHAVRERGVHAMVAQTLRFDSTVAAVRPHIETIAPLHAVTLVQRFEPSTLPWIDRPSESGGGILLHTGVHSIDLLRTLSGHEVTDVACVTARVFTRETEDNFVLLARLDRAELLGQVSGSRALGARTGLVELAGAGGQIVADHVRREAWLVRGPERMPIAIPEARPTVRDTLRAFVAAVRERMPTPIPVDEGVRALAIIDAAYRSAAHGGLMVRVEN